MRRAITCITRTSNARRPAAPPPGPCPQAARDPEASTPPRRPRAPRRPRTVPPALPPQPARPGWIARWFGRTWRQPAPSSVSPRPETGDAPFTPEAYPGLSPEACAILNTPVEECDSEVLRLVLSLLAVQIAETLEPGLTDSKAVFATLWDRLAGPLGNARPEAVPAAEPDAALAGPLGNARPEAELAVVPDAAPATAPDAVLDAPAVSPDARPAAAATSSPDSAAIAAIPAREPTPDAPLLPQPGLRRIRSRRHADRRRVRCHRLVGRVLPDRRQALPARRLCYAACAGPP